MKFTKMHATGNDFIVIDGRSEKVPPVAERPAFMRAIAHRNFGIGADQILVLEASQKADFRMLIYNADGSEVEMCGNGIRALAKYVWDRRISDKDTLDVETLAGIIRPSRAGELVRVDMGVPELEGRRIPVNLDGQVIDHPLTVKDRTFKITCVSMGNPHAVIYVDDVAGFPVAEYGPLIENHALFPKRTNTEFIQVLGLDRIRMRVWERGAGETLACGTGACASAVASMAKGLTARRLVVELLGGELHVEWSPEGRVYMTGPAVHVFEGVWTSKETRG